MQILTRQKQQDIYKRIVEVIKVLASEQSADSMDRRYAMGDMWQIARMVGGKEMVDALNSITD